MSLRFLTVLLFGASALLAQQTAESYRTWTSADGKKIEATLLGVENGIVKIKLRTGAVFPVPLDRLSAEDQVFANSAAQPAAPGKTDSKGHPSAGKDWPRGVALDEPPEPVIVTEDKAKKEFIYRSQHYEFRCDSKLGTNVVKEFCRIFEATWKLNCVIPLDLKPEPEDGQEYFVAKLYTSKEDYFTNGGLKGSAGVYSSRDKALSVPLSSLGVKMVGSRVSLEKTNEDDNDTLVHEITHQMMNHWLGRLRTWFIEGSAVCVEMIEYQHGRFSLNGLNRRIPNYLKRHGSDGKNFTMLDPEELVTLDGATWAAALGNSQRQASQNYASAALLTFYFYHLDDKGDSAHIIDYLRDLEQIKSRRDDKELFQKHLIRERSFEEIRTDIKKKFRKDGINIDFASKGKNTITSQ